MLRSFCDRLIGKSWQANQQIVTSESRFVHAKYGHKTSLEVFSGNEIMGKNY